MQQRKEVVICKKCGCDWLELIKVKQYPSSSIILGQEPRTTSKSFYLFKCPECSSLQEPDLISSLNDKDHQEYLEFLNEIIPV